MSRRFGGQAPFGGKGSNADTIGSAAVVQKSTAALLQQACVSGSLKLANRELSSLPKALFELAQIDYQGKKWWEEQDLHTVDFSHNQLTEIPNEFINVLGCLRIFIGSYNVLAAFQSDFLLACQQTLTKLDLSHNQLTWFLELDEDNPAGFPVFTALAEVDVSHNQIDRLNGLSTLAPELTFLDASNNRLTTFESRGVYYGRAVGISKPPFSSLRTLNLSNNRLAALPAALALECNTSLETVNLSCNFLTLVADDGQSLTCFGPNITSLNLKQNRVVRLSPEQIFCPRLKELTVGNNGIQRLPDNLFVRSPAIAFLDLSNNKLVNIDAVLRLEHLARLDIQNNDIGTLNPRLCLLPKLVSIVLDGNPLRSIRRDIISKGTVELLKYLRTRLSAEENDETARRIDEEVKQLELRRVATPGDSPPRHLNQSRVSAAVRTQLDRPYATQANAGVHHQASDAAREEAQRREEERLLQLQNKASIVPEGAKLIHAGERNGTTWDLSLQGAKGAAAGRSFAASKFDQQVTFGRSSSFGAANNSNPVLPAVVDVTLNFSTMHAFESAPFRNQVTIIRLNQQPEVEAIDLSFTTPFPMLRELVGNKCPRLAEIFVDPDKAQIVPNGQIAALHSLMFAGCNFSGTLLPNILGAFESPLGRTLTRLDFSANNLNDLPHRMPEVCPNLRYIDLSYNKISRFPTVLLQLPSLIELNFAHNGVLAVPDDEEGDFEGYAQRCWPVLQLLDLSYNELTTIPFTFGNLSGHLRTLGLEGNRIKWMRSATLQKGTAAVLQYLRDKIPQPVRY